MPFGKYTLVGCNYTLHQMGALALEKIGVSNRQLKRQLLTTYEEDDLRFTREQH